VFPVGVKINESKSIYTTFTLKQQIPPPVLLSKKLIPHSGTIKYLGLFFDKRLIWAKYVHNTKIALNRRLSLLSNILGKSSKLNLKTKITLFNLLLKTIWSYGIQV